MYLCTDTMCNCMLACIWTQIINVITCLSKAAESKTVKKQNKSTQQQGRYSGMYVEEVYPSILCEVHHTAHTNCIIRQYCSQSHL